MGEMQNWNEREEGGGDKEGHEDDDRRALTNKLFDVSRPYKHNIACVHFIDFIFI